MEEDTDIIPMFTADLIKHLDEIVARPEFPSGREQAAAFDDRAKRRGIFQAGMREMVDMLIEWQKYSEELAKDADSDADVSSLNAVRVAGEGGDVHTMFVSDSE